jgi:hypothetical protein
MANECKVFEQTLPRSPNAPIRTAPFRAWHELSTTVTSAAFGGSTHMITVVSSLAGTVEIAANPTGTGPLFPIAANTPYDFSVIPGHKIRFV